MGERQKYKVRINGNDTVLNLTPEDAEKLYPDNAEPVTDEPAEKPDPATSKARLTANKARYTAENK